MIKTSDIRPIDLSYTNPCKNAEIALRTETAVPALKQELTVTDRILESGMLAPSHHTALAALEDELVDNWGKRQVFRTETEMRMSVLNDGVFPTPASKYWQCVREQAVMLDNLAMTAFDYRRNEVKIARLQQKLQQATDPFDADEAQIDLDECLFKRASMQQSANDRMREVELWSKIKKELDNGSFDTTDVNTHQLVSYHAVLKNRLATLTPGSSQAEVLNVKGPLMTTERLLSEKGML